MDNKNTMKETIFEKRGREKAKGKSFMTTFAVLAVVAIAATGLFMNGTTEQELIPNEKSNEIVQNANEESGDLDLAKQSELQSVDSTTVKNPGITTGKIKKPATDTSHMLEEEVTDTQEVLSGEVENMMFNFTGMNMLWPIAIENKVLIPYSMEKAVYFETLDQYKYNPAMIISAEVGTPVVAVSAGKITKRYWDYETGWTYEMDLGGGFKAYYGQLENLQKAEDTYIIAGDVLGYVASPTKYYSKEGSNLYFAMTKDGKPVYPKEYINE